MKKVFLDNLWDSLGETVDASGMASGTLKDAHVYIPRA